MNHTKKREFLIRYLLDEDKRYSSMDIPINEDEQKQLLRALFNIRMPKETTLDFMQIQDEYLQEENESRGITDYHDLTPIEKGIYLWQGDISTLKCDAIVNAANSQMLGCFRPNHSCIDNCIHTFAGIQLRATCFEIMEKQGHEEETGSAKITPAFNLPSKYVIHTVGPIVEDRLTERHEKLLESCYKSCLELAEKNGLKSIAFCCISTGVFMFPNQRAAEIAVDTVKKFKEHSNIEVIFNVFKDTDLQIYRELLGTD
ncbi:MAG: protein-ADP-ribose hydrolase [Ruminococcus sp.]|nr:protein-ADP-ribose hydrolase [Ruminococcus sp.]MCD7799781.1 protein-ADP-ribose hydrolase [Ruminococcus sp.]